MKIVGYMKHWSIIVLSIGINVALAKPQVVDQVAAIVDNAVILDSDVKKNLNTVKNSIQEANTQFLDEAMLRQQILDRLIMDNIILQLAQRTNTTVSDKQLDKTIGNIAAKSNMTIDQLRRRLSYDGVNYPNYRAQISNEILIDKVRHHEMRRRITILPQEIQLWAKKMAVKNRNSAAFNLSYMLIPLPKNASQHQVDKAKFLANALVKQRKLGVKFSELAIIYSNAASQKLKNAQMSWSTLAELPSLFSELLLQAQPGSIIGPISSGVGFHILKVNNIRGGNQKVTVTEVHARHIMLSTSSVGNAQQACAKLDDLAKQIKNNRINFSTAAKQLSEDPESANQGGDLGWRSVDTFDPELRKELMHLKKGEISSSLVKSAYGWHLLQLLDTRQVDSTDNVQKERAYRLLFNRKFADEVQIWMQEHRASTYVQIIHNNAPQ